MEALIRVVVLDFYGCEREVLRDAERLKHILLESARVMGATVVDSKFTTYNPEGISGVVIIAESHLAIHTWPEYGYSAVTFET
ncbi:adenosylmethionine decarboxylase, partial [Candidatus Sumerlaeota bacterium]|nr:adenosylmethionine decarboxylase [Candidatus Sumerlaeota bacterium]